MKKLMSNLMLNNRKSRQPKPQMMARLVFGLIALLVLSACGTKVHYGPPTVDSGNIAVDVAVSLLGGLLIMDEDDRQLHDEREKVARERTIRQIGNDSAEEP